MKRPATRVADLLNPAALLLPAANVIIYVCMALVLTLRPQGLLGESEVIRQ